MLLLLEWPVTTTVTIEWEERGKSREDVMKMLETFDLTGSFGMSASWPVTHRGAGSGSSIRG